MSHWNNGLIEEEEKAGESKKKQKVWSSVDFGNEAERKIMW